LNIENEKKKKIENHLKKTPKFIKKIVKI